MRATLIAVLLAASLDAQAPALRIVVVEGEDAVNIVQQKTAVRPLVEVRDRNNVPVAGATVTFTIGGGQPAAFAGGLQTLTVTTNAAGQAAASGMSALGPGAVQINVQAAFQGQIATAAISQTNFATAAAAAQASSAASGASGGAGGSSGAASGGAAGGGGGISGTTIGIVGAAVAGGAIAATQVGGKDGDGALSSDNSKMFTGSYSGQIVVTTLTSDGSKGTSCVSTRALSGTVTITLRDGDASGTLNSTGTQQEVSTQCALLGGTGGINVTGPITGGPSNLLFTSQSSNTSTTPATVTSTETVKFTGSLSAGVITGTLGYQHQTRGSNSVNGVSTTIAGDGQTSFAMTLR